MNWFEIENSERIFTPSLAIYADRMEQNIDRFIAMCNDAKRLRPHVKTNKIKEVCEAMMRKGVSRFKCATLAELEMLCSAGAKDILLAYPLAGANIGGFIQLQKKYRVAQLSFLADNILMISVLEKAFAEAGLRANIFIDVNVGMNRTGCKVENMLPVYESITSCKHLSFEGFHAYDGHIHDGNKEERCRLSKEATRPLFILKKQLEEKENRQFQLVIGGTPTFACYLNNEEVQLSPGTFVFWDYSYKKLYPELPFDYAALVLTRIISVLDDKYICLDLGHKAIAAEMPQPRLAFLNLENARIVSQSEEHLVVEVPDTAQISLGTIIYGVPVHICPTVAKYDKALVVEKNKIKGTWDVIAGKRIY